MKKNVLKTELAALVLLLFSLGVMAQNGNRNVITQTREVGTIEGLSVTGIFKVIFTQGEPQSVKVETDENLIDKVTTEVHGGILELSTKGSINNPSRLNVYITAKSLKSLEMSGASKFSTTNKFVTPELKVELSGITTASINTQATNLNCDLTGVAKLELEGSGDQLSADVSGTAKLTASKYEVKDAKVDVSGVANAAINATASVSLDASGASKISYIPHDNLNIKSKDASGAAKINKSGSVTGINIDTDVNVNTDVNTDVNTGVHAEVNTNGDSTKIRIGKIKLDVIEGPETQIRLGNNKLVVDENGRVQFSKTRRPNSFHSHWSGFYIGVSGYLTPAGRIDPLVHDNFMSLNLIKSTNVQLNLFEQNMRISSNAGFVTGLGIDWRNYRFEHSNVVLQSNSNFFDGTIMTDANYIKSKLLVTYLTVPLLFEAQSNRFTNRNSFHIAGGVSSGLRIGSHSKVKFEKPNGGTEKNKDRSDFDLNPFKLDATVLIGWGSVNLYGNYGLIDMFKVDKGPELRPFSLGIRLVFD